MMLKAFLNSITSFRSHQSGNVALLFGLAAVPLFAFAGGAMDFAKANRVQKALQEALDAAALAGVTGARTDEEQIAIANAYFEANRPASIQVEQLTFQKDGEKLVAHAGSSVPTAFLGLINMPVLEVATESIATSETINEPLCVMAMHPTRKHTLELSGSVDVIGPACNFYGNSTNPDDVVDPHNASNFLTGRSVQANGYGHHYIENVTPPLEYAPKVLSDPLGALAIPAAGACTFTGKKVSGGTATLTPGTYCDGLEITGNATVTLSPGVYFIKQEEFKIKDSTVTGSGVTIVLSDNKAKIEWETSIIRLKAPTTGSRKGLVFMGDRINMQHTIDKATVDLEGVVYLPNGDFRWTNTGTPTLEAKWTAWVVDGFSWDGDGTINMNFDIDDSDIPYPDELLHVIPRKGTPRLIY